MSDDRYFDPFVHNGRWLGRWLQNVGRAVERLGVVLQDSEFVSNLRWRRWR